jgi:Asp-tRNA(Asn)/Glu-tRNA(Gln) amidotransferase A subunit family amidase
MRALSSVELTVLYLNRIQAYDRHGIHLNAVIVDNPAALADAAAADAARAGGRAAGPLLGVPYTIKDSYKAKGLTVAAGSPAFAHLIANEDAFTVARVRAAGGVLLGKTNMPPLAAGGCRRASMAARKALTIPIISPPRGTRARPTVRAAPHPPASPALALAKRRCPRAARPRRTTRWWPTRPRAG